MSYFLSYFAYLIPKLDFLTADGTAGWPGVAKSVFFTGPILGIVAIPFTLPPPSPPQSPAFWQRCSSCEQCR